MKCPTGIRLGAADLSSQSFSDRTCALVTSSFGHAFVAATDACVAEIARLLTFGPIRLHRLAADGRP